MPVSINSGNFAGRAIPDVAANADPATGYFEVSGGKQGVVGGTSASAPLWASLIARINAVMKVNVGNFNALLYSQFGPSGILRDITVGNNDTDGLLNGQFPAGPGWDGAPPRLGAQREAALPRLRSPAGSERLARAPCWRSAAISSKVLPSPSSLACFLLLTNETRRSTRARDLSLFREGLHRILVLAAITATIKTFR